MIIAVDFDDTLKIAEKPNIPLIARLKHEQAAGNIVILWTCRNGKRLSEAVEFLLKNGLKVNYINQNPPETVRRFGYDSRKVYADVYIDDKAVRA